MSVCGLEVYVGGTGCDGCGRRVPRGEPYLSGIDSCCGNCSRSLCASCVAAGAALLAQAALRLSMATPEETSHAAG